MLLHLEWEVWILLNTKHGTDFRWDSIKAEIILYLNCAKFTKHLCSLLTLIVNIFVITLPPQSRGAGSVLTSLCDGQQEFFYSFWWDAAGDFWNVCEDGSEVTSTPRSLKTVAAFLNNWPSCYPDRSHRVCQNTQLYTLFFILINF